MRRHPVSCRCVRAAAGRSGRLPPWTVAAVAWALVLCACALPREPERPDEPVAPLTLVQPEEIPEFCDDLFYDSLMDAAGQSLLYLRRADPSRRFAFGEDSYDTAHMIKSLEAFRDMAASRPSCAQMRRNIRESYRVYRAAGRKDSGTVLFTGYYEPILMGSLQPSAAYPWPLYTRPDDLLTIDLRLFGDRFAAEAPLVGRLSGTGRVVPYYDRREIVEQNRLEGRAKPLVWLKSRIDRFFLEIQGSGKVYLEGGGVMNVHYHAKNGRPYRSIGALLADTGRIARSDVSMQSIRAYLEAHPDEVAEILYHNPSFVFFKAESEGPLGALGVCLTPGRSLAVDRSLFPDAAPVFIASHKPVLDAGGRIASWQPFGRFVFNQDTGGAIRGPGRADLFWGNGPYAEIAAGHLQHPGALYVLVLKPEG